MEDEQRYSNRQIERLLDEQTRVLTKSFQDELAPILVQTTKTNGRVTALEKANITSDKKLDRVGFYLGLVAVIVSGAWALFLAVISSGFFNHFPK